MLISLKREGVLNAQDSLYLGGVLTVLYDNDRNEGIEGLILKIRGALLTHNSNVTEAAKAIGMHRPDLWFIIEENHALFADLFPTVQEGQDLYARELAKAERSIILKALAQCGGSPSIAARVLGLKRTTLLGKCARLMISTAPDNHDSNGDRRGNGPT